MGQSEWDAAGEDERGSPGHSRRAFLVSAAGLTGVAVASGAWRAPVFADSAPTAAAAPASLLAGDIIDLTLDGASAGFIWTCEGGHATADVILEKSGADGIVHKHIGAVKYEDITVTLGANTRKGMYEWIKASFDSKFSRKSGELVVADFHDKRTSSLQFSSALISEIGFPALDAASKDAAKMTIKFSPEVTRYSPSGGQAPPRPAPIQKKWTPANFRLKIDGLDTSRVEKIEAITVKQVNIVHTPGTGSAGGLVPVGLEIPNLAMQLPEAGADSWLQWHKDSMSGKFAGPAKGGELTLMAADGSEVFTLGLQKLGIFKLTPEKVEAGSQGIRRLKAEMYCEVISFSFPPSAP